MSERVTQRASSTDTYSVRDSGESLSRQCIESVSGQIDDANSGEVVQTYPTFAPALTDAVLVRLEEEMLGKPLVSWVTLKVDVEALSELQLSTSDLRFFATLRDTTSAWCAADFSLPIDVSEDEVSLEFALHEILPRQQASYSEIAIDVLSTKRPNGFAAWAPSAKLISFTLQHSDRDNTTDFPPKWISAEDFRDKLGLPEETLSYFDPGPMDEPVSKATLWVNSEYKELILGASATSGGISRNFITLVKGDIIEAAILSEDFELSIDYRSGTVGAALQGLLKSEGHRSRKEGLAKFRKDRKGNEQPSLARLCSCIGKNEIRKLLK